MTLMALFRNNQPTGYRKTIHNQQEYSSGFTLIELMAIIAIAAILFGVAIPSFSSTITYSRLTSSANDLVLALNIARSEAIKRGQQVVVRKTYLNGTALLPTRCQVALARSHSQGLSIPSLLNGMTTVTGQ